MFGNFVGNILEDDIYVGYRTMLKAKLNTLPAPLSIDVITLHR